MVDAADISYLRHEWMYLVFFTNILSRWDERPKCCKDSTSVKKLHPSIRAVGTKYKPQDLRRFL